MKTVAVVMAFLLLACGCEKSPTYQGKSVDEWITLSDDADPVTRQGAYKALASLKSDDQAFDKLGAGLQHHDRQVKLICASARAFWIDDTGKVNEAINSILLDHPTLDELRDLVPIVSRMENRASPLTVTVRQLQASPDYRDPQSQAALAVLLSIASPTTTPSS